MAAILAGTSSNAAVIAGNQATGSRKETDAVRDLRAKEKSARSRGQLPQAITFIDEALKLKPNDDTLLMEKARCLLDLDESDSAIAILEQVRRANGASIEVCRLLSEEYSQKKEFDKARLVLDEGLKKFPREYYLWTEHANIDYACDRFTQCLSDIEQAGKVLPLGRDQIRLKGKALMQLGRYKEAAAVFASVPHKVHNHKADVLDIIACLSTSKDTLDQAIAFATQELHCLDLPDQAGVLRLRAKAYRKKGEPKKAAVDEQQALKLEQSLF
jgi:predicted Zn-dependent protease